MALFQKLTTAHGLTVFLRSTTQFKTTMVQLLIDRPFLEDYSLFALLPHVLKRGSADYPDSLALERRFDELYGASFDVCTHRVGERHLVEFRLEVVDHALLADGSDLLQASLETLAGIILRPRLEAGVFCADYVAEEQEAQIRAIQSIYNDKAEYAHMRCLQSMWQGDAFSRLAIGDAEQVAAITPASLQALYAEVLQSANFQVFLTGNLQAAEVQSLCAGAFQQPLGQPRSAPVCSALPAERPPQELQEEQPVAQGKLVLAYRTGIRRTDELFLPLLVFNGLLGGYSHSKLFQVVREQASLAYDCGSDLIATKGVLLVEAGISPEDLPATRRLIDEQLQALARGKWTDEEWDKTLLALQTGLRGLADRPGRLALAHFERLLAGIEQTEQQLIEGIQAVTRQQVLAVAASVQLDTAYFLQGSGEDEENE